jgi:hypothetical protein
MDLTIYFDTPITRAHDQYRRVVEQRFSYGIPENLSVDNLVERRFEEHDREIGPLVDYLRQVGDFIQVNFPFLVGMSERLPLIFKTDLCQR